MQLNKYIKNGYLISDKIMQENEVKSLRDDLDKEFTNHNDVQKLLHFFKDEKLIKKILNLYSHNILNNIKVELSKFSETKVSILPHFLVQKNYHVNLGQVHGWHRDCGGELQYDYCNKILGGQKYIFSKVAFYLQENNEYGGSVDIIKNSHKNFSKFKIFLRKIKAIPFKIVTLFHKYFRKIYNFLPESFFMFILGAKRLYPQIGAAVLFDSRIIHRGSPISKKKLKEIKYIEGAYQADTPKHATKYTIYCHIGTTDALDSYFYDRLKRKNSSEELKIWSEQVNFISKFDSDLAKEMSQVLEPIQKKYSNFV